MVESAARFLAQMTRVDHAQQQWRRRVQGSRNSSYILSAIALTVSRPTRSATFSGPIGCAQPRVIPLSMSSTEANPLSAIRIADSRYGTSNALTMYRTCRPNAPPACRGRRAKSLCARGCLGRRQQCAHQLDQRQHRDRMKEVHADHPAGSAVTMPSLRIGIDDELDASTASGSVTIASGSANRPVLTLSSSTTASMTNAGRRTSSGRR